MVGIASCREAPVVAVGQSQKGIAEVCEYAPEGEDAGDVGD
jgi:hypothetical protein